MAKLGDENLSGPQLLLELAKLAKGPVPYLGNMLISEMLKRVESGADLPKGILGAVTDPRGLVKDYFKTEAGNQILGNSNTSNLENLLNQLQPSQFEQSRTAGETPASVPSSITAPDAVQPVDANIDQLYAILNNGSNTRSLSSQPSDTQAGPGYTFDPNTGTAVPIDDTQVGPGYRFDPTTGTAVPIEVNAAPEGFRFDSNLGVNVPNETSSNAAPSGYTFDPDLGMNVPSNTGGGGKLEDYLLQAQEYKRGGEICGCKR
jgi:hypothetical protein